MSNSVFCILNVKKRNVLLPHSLLHALYVLFQVVFTTALGNTVTVHPGSIELKEPGKLPKPLCGKLECGQLAVEDLGVSAEHLQAQLQEQRRLPQPRIAPGPSRIIW